MVTLSSIGSPSGLREYQRSACRRVSRGRKLQPRLKPSPSVTRRTSSAVRGSISSLWNYVFGLLRPKTFEIRSENWEENSERTGHRPSVVVNCFLFMPNCRTFHCNQSLSRLVNAGLLIVWLISCHAFGPLLIMSVAGITGGHTMKLCASLSGEVSVVLGHSDAGISRQADWWGGSTTECELTSIVAVSEPDHCVRLRSIEEVSTHTRRVVAKAPLEVVLPVWWVSLVNFRVAGDESTALYLRPPMQGRWTAGLHVKAGKSVMRC
jgi:hypothetical protein